MELGCDGLSALVHAMQKLDITNPKMPQFNLLAATRMTVRRCPVQIWSQHIKGHQDDEVGALLDRWALLNIEVDDGANTQWWVNANQTFHQAKIFGEPWPLWIKNDKISNNLAEKVVGHVHGSDRCEYWKNVGGSS